MIKRLLPFLLFVFFALPSSASEIRQPDNLKASSVLGGGDYDSPNLWDNDKSTAWIEGVVGTGVGEYVDFSVPEGTVITGGIICPGYTKSYDLFFKNAAPSTMRFETDGDARYLDVNEYVWDFNTCLSGITFTFGTPLTSSGHIWAYIDSVRGGNTYDDTCISELRLFGYKPEGGASSGTAPSQLSEDEQERFVLMFSSFYSWYVGQNYGYASGPVSTDITLSELYPGSRAFLLYWYQYNVNDERIVPYDAENNIMTRALAEQLEKELFGEYADNVWLEYTGHYADYQSGDTWLSPSTGDFGDAGSFYFGPVDFQNVDGNRYTLSGPLNVWDNSYGNYAPEGRYKILLTANGTGGADGRTALARFEELIVDTGVDSQSSGQASAASSGYTLDQLKTKALNYCEAEFGYRPACCDADINEEGMISIHLYDMTEIGTFTTAWLSVNEFGVGHDPIMGELIDISGY